MKDRCTMTASGPCHLALLATILAVSGCVSVTAPDKPIVINLNINVTQQVVYRLDNQAKSLIQQNPGIF
jgi:hypothetical protein